MNQTQATALFVGAGVLAVAAAVVTAPLLADALGLQSPDATAPAGPDAPSAGPQRQAPLDPNATGHRIPKPPARNKGQRRAVPAATATRVGAQAPAPSPAQAPSEPDDDTGAYGRVDPTVAFSPAALQATMTDLAPDMEACVSEWAEQLDAFEGEVVLRAELTPEGLAEVAIDDYDVPLPILGCLSVPVWEATWPAPSEPTTLRYPFVIQGDDSDEAAEGAGEDGGEDVDQDDPEAVDPAE